MEPIMPAPRLISVQYLERKDRPKKWSLEGLTLGPVNLIVGRNATGKSRSLNIIWNLSRMLHPSDKFRVDNAGYDLLFDNAGSELRYILYLEGGKVVQEEVVVDGENKLNRGLEGGGIFTK